MRAVFLDGQSGKPRLCFMKLTFPLGTALVFIGLALASLVNYLDMRQFEPEIPGIATADWQPTDGSGIYQELKSQDEFAKKYFTPEQSMWLLRDYLTMGNYTKPQFQSLRDSVSKKKLDALHNLSLFLCLAAMMGIVNYSTILKVKNQSVKLG